MRTAGRQLQEIFDGEVVLYLREPSGSLSLRFGEEPNVAEQPINEVVAQWVATNGKIAGAGTDTLPNATALFVPLAGSQQVVGALGVAPKEQGPVPRSRAGSAAGNLREPDRAVDRTG